MYRILIADVDQLALDALSIMIGQIDGCKLVATASSGDEVLKILEKKPCDLVLLNVLLPAIAGTQVASLIHQENPKSKVYLMTSLAADLIVTNELRDSISGLLEKPVMLSDLKKLVEGIKTESNTSLQPILERLITLVNTHDYTSFFHEIHQITEQIYKSSENEPDQISKSLHYVGQSLINVPEFFLEDDKEIRNIFPLNEGLIKELMMGEFWLFQVTDRTFTNSAIKRYPLLENIFSYIESHIKEDLSLKTITQECVISQGYLSRIFKEMLGVSVMDYLHMRKIYLAKAYFYYSDSSIADVAFNLGYNEGSYFSKVFKKYEGVTIREFREKCCSRK